MDDSDGILLILRSESSDGIVDGGWRCSSRSEKSSQRSFCHASPFDGRMTFSAASRIVMPRLRDGRFVSVKNQSLIRRNPSTHLYTSAALLKCPCKVSGLIYSRSPSRMLSLDFALLGVGRFTLSIAGDDMTEILVESPKSAILTEPSRSSRMLDGLRSRCNTSKEWMWRRPDVNSVKSFQILPSSKPPSSATLMR